ncbi:DUF5630 domain-containing protein [Legionella rowbothamii]|uniref:DUF5630 domain-containing protein n=1 Tax=Legionella rowbothamii TaxID=96229 RepID=UPI001055D386|nr:DUF5630 domain-containing protein [Legionella rowbothamii]
MFFQKKVVSLNDYLALNALERIFLNEFIAMSIEDKISTVEDLICQNQFDFIVKLSSNEIIFREICLDQRFNSTWESCWSTFGVIITGDPNRAFFDQPCKNVFDLFLGVYLYNKSRAFRDTPSIENAYLVTATKYGSIHALQRYCFSLYERLDNENEQLDMAVTPRKIEGLIRAIKEFLPFYRAYAYLMLAEAYIRYGRLKPELASEATKSALTACSHAKKLNKEGDPVVFNASLGAGLAASNSKGYATPEEAAEAIESQLYAEAPKRQQAP